MRKPSPATVIASVALFVALGGAGIAANGQGLILGHTDNSATSKTALSAPVNDNALQLTNTNTGTSATALGLNVAPGHAPFTVNTQRKVANLNADQLDGLDGSQFVRTSTPGTGKLVGEPWHEAAFAPQPGVCYAYADNCSWQNYGSGYTTAAYYKDPVGVVHLKGLIKPDCSYEFTSCDVGQPVFTLPAGYRPAARELHIAATAFVSAADFETGRVDVTTDGTVLVVQSTASIDSNNWVSLDGITFRAAQ